MNHFLVRITVQNKRESTVYCNEVILYLLFFFRKSRINYERNRQDSINPVGNNHLLSLLELCKKIVQKNKNFKHFIFVVFTRRVVMNGNFLVKKSNTITN